MHKDSDKAIVTSTVNEWQRCLALMSLSDDDLRWIQAWARLQAVIQSNRPGRVWEETGYPPRIVG